MISMNRMGSSWVVGGAFTLPVPLRRTGAAQIDTYLEFFFKLFHDTVTCENVDGRTASGDPAVNGGQ
jgi:hypothetical protein